MASNAKTVERKQKNDAKRSARWSKMMGDFAKVRQTGEEHVSHYVGGGLLHCGSKENPNACHSKAVTK